MSNIIEILSLLVGLAVDVLRMELPLLGMTISLWNIMIYVLVAVVIIELIGRILK